MDTRMPLWFFFCCFLLAPPSALGDGKNVTITLDSPFLGIAYHNCLHNATELSVTYQENLGIAFKNLISQSEGLKYASTSEGFGNDTVHTMFQCRGDQSPGLCVRCLFTATIQLPGLCPSSIGARIQYDGCYLRYDNEPFFTPDFSFAIGYCYAKSSDPVALAAISSLVQNVTNQAPKQGGFASTNPSVLNAFRVSPTERCVIRPWESRCISPVATTVSSPTPSWKHLLLLRHHLLFRGNLPLAEV